MAIKRYEFPDALECGKAAGDFYTRINNLAFKTTFENMGGLAHQIYRVFNKDEERLKPGNEIMRFEYNGTVSPATIRFDFGTSRHKHTFESLASAVMGQYGVMQAIMEREGK